MNCLTIKKISESTPGELERLRAENEKLKQENHCLREIMGHAPFSLYISDIRTDEVLWASSPQDYNFFRELFSNEEVLIKRIHPDDLRILKHVLDCKFAKGESEGSFMVRVMKDSSAYNWFHCAWKRIRLAKKGQRIMLLSGIRISSSIVESAQYEMLLQEQMQKLYGDVLHDLSEREIDVMKYLANGHSIKEASVKLNLSQHTVANHKKNIFGKLNICKITDLTRLAVMTGLV